MPLRGRATPVKKRGLPGWGNSKEVERTGCWKWSYMATRNFVPCGAGVNFKMPEERVTVSAFLSGRRLCPKYPVYPKRVRGGCRDRKEIGFADTSFREGVEDVNAGEQVVDLVIIC